MTATRPLALAALAATFAGALGLTTAAAGDAVAAPAPKTASPLPGNLSSELKNLRSELEKLPAELGKLPPEIERALNELLPTTGRGRAVKPVNGVVTSHYGARWGTHHNGVDIANRIGVPVRAVTDGVVIQAGPASGYGLWIRVRQDDGTTGIFGHVDQIFVRAGQKVQAGQTIGTVGNRGNSTGPHLHYEVWNTAGTPIDPTGWLNRRGVHL